MNAGVRRARVIGTASVLLWAFFIAGGIAEGWAASNLPFNTDGLRFYLESVATSPPVWSLLLLEAGAGVLVAFSLAVALERVLKGRITRAGLLACTVLFL